MSPAPKTPAFARAGPGGLEGKTPRDIDGRDIYALVFGLFLGLALVKFGNPVILDRVLTAPRTLSEVWAFSWPDWWSYWMLTPLVLAGLAVGMRGRKSRKPPQTISGRKRPNRELPSPPPARAFRVRWLWILPLAWFGWQMISAMQTVDWHLTVVALAEFAGCLACYFCGVLVLGSRRLIGWLLVGLLAGFAFCLVRATHQRLIEYPQERQMLLEGQRTGWTNFAPEYLAILKRNQVIVVTNGVEVANPYFLAKYAKERVSGTLIYPNALAGALLLLWPVSIAAAFGLTRRFRTITRGVVIALTLLLGGAVFFWTGSKLAWLIGVAVLCGWLLHLDRPRQLKVLVLAGVVVMGMAVFAIRFRGYFEAGAKSLGARFDYWRAAVQVVERRPWTGSGPGTFQKPYEAMKTSGEEMARLAHNDYLEQFSDSGIIGGLAYLSWIALALVTVGRKVWRSSDLMMFGVFAGVTAWFLQGVGEFSLYIPGLAWPAFTLLGFILGPQPQAAIESAGKDSTGRHTPLPPAT